MYPIELILKEKLSNSPSSKQTTINYLDANYPFKLLKAIGNPVSSKRFENHYYAARRCNMNAIAAKAPLTTEINKSLKKRSQALKS